MSPTSSMRPAVPLLCRPALDEQLHRVTFAVLDVETTGGSPGEADLLEVGVATYRGGKCLGTFDTLVHPGVPIPPFVSELTGITDAMVGDSPAPAAVLPALMAHLGDSVIVGHNVGFDVGFLDAALVGAGREPLAHLVVDTLALARRLVRDVVPDCSLSTLAAALDLEHRPSHRALADALATADLLHRMIELATGYGVLRLVDLLSLPDRIAPMPVAGAGSSIPA